MPTINSWNSQNPAQVALGGTGATTLTSNGVLYGSGTSAIGATTAGTTGQVLIATTSSAPSFGGTPLTVTCDTSSAAASSSAVTFNAVSQAGSSVSFSGSSATVSLNTSDANNNTCVGNGAGNASISGADNNGFGVYALHALTSGNRNCIFGTSSGQHITSGGDNSVFGYTAFGSGTLTGSYNVIIGSGAGSSYTTSEASNVLINNSGTVGESNVLRIGSATGTGNDQLNAAYICGITGKTSASGAEMFCNSSNLLGTTTSSIRYKQNVQDIGKSSERIYQLRPVSFNYKVSLPHVDEEDAKVTQFGLIAEEVKDIIPEMLIYDKDGQIESLKYRFLAPLLLNEIQKLNKRIEELEKRPSMS